MLLQVNMTDLELSEEPPAAAALIPRMRKLKRRSELPAARTPPGPAQKASGQPHILQAPSNRTRVATISWTCWPALTCRRRNHKMQSSGLQQAQMLQLQTCSMQAACLMHKYILYPVQVPGACSCQGGCQKERYRA